MNKISNTDGTRHVTSASMPRSADSLVGQVLAGRYRVVEGIGRGGMGMVYHGIQLNVDRDVAIKVIKSEAAESVEAVKRFEVEAHVISRLAHPHTLRLYDFWQAEDGRLFLITEFLQGTPLDKLLLKQGRLTPVRTLRLLRQICGALAEAHGKGIVHRDLKPSNIFVQQLGHEEFVKLIDFGIAKVADGSIDTATGKIFGSPAYMSPEQARGDDIGSASDLYSLGIVAYECLTGEVPFHGSTTYSVLLKHMNEPPASLRSIQPPIVEEEIDDLVMTLLAKLPDDRPKSAAIVQEDITWLLDNQTDNFVARPKVAAPNNEPVVRSRESALCSEDAAAPRRSRSLWALLILLPAIAMGSWLIRADVKSPRGVLQDPDMGVDAAKLDALARIEPDTSPDVEPVTDLKPAPSKPCGVDTVIVELSPRRSAYGPAERIKISGMALDCRNRPLRDVTLRWSLDPHHCAEIDSRGLELAHVACTGRVKACAEGGETCSSALFEAAPKADPLPTVCVAKLDNPALEVGERLRFRVVCLDENGQPVPDAHPDDTRLAKVHPAECAKLTEDNRGVDLLCECTGELGVCIRERCTYAKFAAMDAF